MAFIQRLLTRFYVMPTLFLRAIDLAQTFIRARCQGIRIKCGVVISPQASLRRMGGSIELGRRTKIHRGVLLWAYGGKIVIGDNCTVNPYTIIYGHGNTIIGNHVRIAAHVVIIPANHQFVRDELISQQSLTAKGVTIGDDVWIGAGSIILDGVTVQTGCVVAAGSVITKTTEPYGMYAGVPANKIGTRKASTHES